jgi:ArsR family transcriptional regulator
MKKRCMTDQLIQITDVGESCGCETCSPLPTEEAETFAALFKALSHPVRVKMLDIIRQAEGDVCVCDVEGNFDLSQPTISHHLKILRDSGLIESQQRGLWVYHRLRPQMFATVQSFLERFR